jgi:Zn-dependent protease
MMNCSRCLAPLQPEDKLCPQCYALVQAEQLESLRAQALELEENHDLANAAKVWTAAQALLPSDSKQAQWIAEHVRSLAQGPSQPPARASNAWAKRLGPLAPLVILLTKAKTVFFALFKLKFLFSFAAFLGLYWAMFGAWFGLGFAMMILLHEMGHYVEVKRRGLPAEMPVFLPGLGAYVKWQALGVSTEVRALVALAGPAAGTVAAFAAYALSLQNHLPLWSALAHTGAWLNLLNLIPLWMLDGAGAVQTLDRMGRISLMVLSLLLFWWTGQLTLLFLAAGFAWQLYRKQVPQEGSLRVQIYFAVLLAGLSWLLHATPIAAR